MNVQNHPTTSKTTTLTFSWLMRLVVVAIVSGVIVED
jgi:hypothetical protein